MKVLLAAVLLSLVPTAGWAGAWGKSCSFTGTAAGVVGTPSNANKQLSADEFGCYRYVAGDGAHNFASVSIRAPSGLICFDPDIFDTALSGVTMTPHLCLAGAPVEAAFPLRSCISQGGALPASTGLNGTEGAADVQNACLRVGPGVYVFRLDACVGGDICQVSAFAEGAED